MNYYFQHLSWFDINLLKKALNSFNTFYGFNVMVLSMIDQNMFDRRKSMIKKSKNLHLLVFANLHFIKKNTP